MITRSKYKNSPLYLYFPTNNNNNTINIIKSDLYSIFQRCLKFNLKKKKRETRMTVEDHGNSSWNRWVLSIDLTGC